MAYDMITGTVCEKCMYRLSRTIEPFDLSDFDLREEDLGLGEDEELQLEQHVCILAEMDIDGAVIDCNRFVKIQPISLLKTDIFKQ